MLNCSFPTRFPKSGPHVFRITCLGGDGNDVVLTKVEPPVATPVEFSAVPGTGANAGFNIVHLAATAGAGLTCHLEGSTDLAT